jgi:palmitoyltransferase
MELSNFSVPSVYALIFFLSYTSQVLLLYLEPGPLSQNELIRFNVLLACLLVCYTRSVIVDPGRISKRGQKEIVEDGKQSRQRWCRKCDAVKPPRAHHCKECKRYGGSPPLSQTASFKTIHVRDGPSSGYSSSFIRHSQSRHVCTYSARCIPKMDHHCPWTSNCVSHTTFPHFIRFLFYAVSSMIYLFKLLWPRIALIWSNRNLPAYLGPSMLQLGHLFLLTVTNFLTLFVLSILLIRNIWCLAVNTTTIEGWEIERHRTLVRRARYFGGYLDGPDGVKMRITHQEFPYDIGIWANFKQGMGTGNILAWFWPFAQTPRIEDGIQFETNGFEDKGSTWPPPDPDRLTRKMPKGFDRSEEAFTYLDEGLNNEETVAAFRERQQRDIVRRRKPFADRLEERVERERRGLTDGEESEGYDVSASEEDRHSGEEGWKNSEGERLRDFGVDEDAEFYDDEEDNIPLSELIARRKQGHGQE